MALLSLKFKNEANVRFVLFKQSNFISTVHPCVSIICYIMEPEDTDEAEKRRMVCIAVAKVCLLVHLCWAFSRPMRQLVFRKVFPIFSIICTSPVFFLLQFHNISECREHNCKICLSVPHVLVHNYMNNNFRRMQNCLQTFAQA